MLSPSHFIVGHPRLRRWLTGLMAPPGERFVTLLGTRLWIAPRLEHGYWRAGKNALNSNVFRYETAGIINLAMLLSEGDTFVDIGANVGLFSATLSRVERLGRGVRFYAFEANPDTFVRLCKGLEGASVEARQTALSDHAGTLVFVPGGVSNAFTTLDHAGDWNIRNEEQEVVCRRLDEEKLEGDRLILKIDVEGQEASVLSGAEGLFEAGRVKAVYLDGFQDKDIPDRLASRGFELFDGWTLEPFAPGGFCLLALDRRCRSSRG